MSTEPPFGPGIGFDSLIAACDPKWSAFLPVGAEMALLGNSVVVVDQDTCDLGPDDLVLAGMVLRNLVRQAIAMGGIPDRVQMARFVVTTDPAVVRRYGEVHDCPTCRAGTDQALAELREHPDQPLIVGVLALG